MAVRFQIIADNQAERPLRQLNRQLQQMGRTTQELQRSTAQQLQDAVRARRTQVRVNERAAREEARAAERSQRDQTRALQDAVRFRRTLLRQEAREAQRAHRDAERAARERVRAEERLLRDLRGAYQNLRRSFFIGGAAVAGGAGLFGRFAIDAAVQYDTIRNSLIALGRTAAEAGDDFERLRNLARLPGISIESAGRGLTQLTGAGVGTDRSFQLIRELGNIAALSGARDIGPGIRALVQIVSRGQVQQEEVNQLTENLAITTRVLANAFQTTNAEQIRAQLTGGVNEFLQRFIQGAQQLGRAPEGLAANVFQNFRLAIRDLAASIGQLALPRLTNTIQELTQRIQANTDTITNSISGLIDALNTAFETLVNNLRSLFTGLTAALAARLAFAGAGHLRNATRHAALASARAVAAGQSVGLLTAALTRFGPIVSSVITGLGVLSTALAAVEIGSLILQFIRGAEATDKIAESISNLNVEVENLNSRGVGIFQNINESLPTASRLSRVVGTLRDVRTEIEGIESAAGTDIGTVREGVLARLTDLRARNVSGARGRGIRRDIEEQRTLLSRINTLLNQRAALTSEIARLEGVITKERQTQVREEAAAAPAFTGAERTPLGRDQRPQFARARRLEGTAEGDSTISSLFQAARSFATSIAELNRNFINPLTRDQRPQFARARELSRTGAADPTFQNLFEALRTTFRTLTERAQEVNEQFVRPIGRDIRAPFARARRLGAEAQPDPTIPNLIDNLRRLGTSITELAREVDRGRRAFAQQAADSIDRLQSNIVSGVNILPRALTDISNIPANILRANQERARSIEAIEEDLSTRLEAIRNRRHLNETQRQQQIVEAEQDAARRRAEVERETNVARTQSYTQFIQNALRSLSSLIAREIQAAVIRRTIGVFESAIAPALLGVPFGPAVAGGLAIAGLLQVANQLVSGSFHLPSNDRVSESAGFARASRRLISNPRSFGQQSANDLVRNYDQGVARGLADTSPNAGSSDNMRPIHIDLNIGDRTVESVFIRAEELRAAGVKI